MPIVAPSLEISRSLFNYLNVQLHAIAGTHGRNEGIVKTYRYSNSYAYLSPRYVPRIIR